LVLSTWVWWCYLHKPDSRACRQGNKDEYEYEDCGDAGGERRRHVEERVVEDLRLAAALRHAPRKPRAHGYCQHIFWNKAPASVERVRR
jgi:hypothetical protein